MLTQSTATEQETPIPISSPSDLHKEFFRSLEGLLNLDRGFVQRSNFIQLLAQISVHGDSRLIIDGVPDILTLKSMEAEDVLDVMCQCGFDAGVDSLDQKISHLFYATCKAFSDNPELIKLTPAQKEKIVNFYGDETFGIPDATWLTSGDTGWLGSHRGQNMRHVFNDLGIENMGSLVKTGDFVRRKSDIKYMAIRAKIIDHKNMDGYNHWLSPVGSVELEAFKVFNDSQKDAVSMTIEQKDAFLSSLKLDEQNVLSIKFIEDTKGGYTRGGKPHRYILTEGVIVSINADGEVDGDSKVRSATLAAKEFLHDIALNPATVVPQEAQPSSFTPQPASSVSSSTVETVDVRGMLDKVTLILERYSRYQNLASSDKFQLSPDVYPSFASLFLENQRCMDDALDQYGMRIREFFARPNRRFELEIGTDQGHILCQSESEVGMISVSVRDDGSATTQCLEPELLLRLGKSGHLNELGEAVDAVFEELGRIPDLSLEETRERVVEGIRRDLREQELAKKVSAIGRLLRPAKRFS